MAEPTQEAAVLRVRLLSPSVREMVLAPLEQKISFKPGQWVSLKLPVGEHPPLNRAYSMAEPESASGHLVLAFDRVSHGLGSEYLFTMKEGNRVVLSGPYGHFVVPDPLTKDLVFIARYTGIVPIRCVLKQLFSTPPFRDVTLIYGGPSRTELIYHDEFTALAAAQRNFHYVPTILNRQEADRESRSEAEIVASLFGNRRDVFPMICGLKAFVRPLRTYFTERGFERRELRHETYD
ncbi:MAG: FAD-dependent oxidoreductase [Nitrospirae bacterium]|nr:FAD-dependent oxidoreductase [Nitrospirota bacterium]